LSEELNVANAIKFLRTKRELSARGLSQAAGLSPSYVSKVEAGELEPSFKAFCRIAEVLKMTDAEVVFLVRLR
jgi:transcriptional regulator with XRE-family HTH domain